MRLGSGTRGGALAAMLGMLVMSPWASASAAAPSVPVPHVGVALPTAYDPVASYEAQAICDPKPKPGAVLLAQLIRRTYGSRQVVGISRACSIGGTSEHKEGRAVDWMTNGRTARGKANAEAFLTWLVGPDEAGVAFGHAIRLGVMYVGWNNRYWAAYAPERGWAELKGCFSKPGRGNDTYCHRNHVHISLSWDGASGRTSLWDGTPLTPYCPAVGSWTPMEVPARTADPVPVTPVVVLSTREGLGMVPPPAYGWREDPPDPTPTADPTPDVSPPTVEPSPEPAPSLPTEPTPTPDPTPTPEATPTSAPGATTPIPTTLPGPACRLHPTGWGRSAGDVLTTVAGKGEVPAVGVAAVAVTVTALAPTAPTEIRAAVPGSDEAVTVLRARMNRRASASAVLPVAADGTFALSNSAGATDVRVTITGYYLVGDQPNLPVVQTSR